ncbi:ATP-dependent Clp protease ATP-binding subunit [Vallitalea pronyensis]|uniref:ATP-dependent Clp protease ATP-binding subunit n=1 Tax=Vallitalea pronyensis TaxID=1348613 RepID=A0A8J8MMT4_9FIRM|nr:ATP-dependent Clp protease ATP-binding subunit [Vallitalea pronyensis]QUI24138.1 ATP-dependent Clp protease ATP-binding subunit [Vallitalea pronyensis]
MKCSMCNENTAVVFVSKIVDGKQERMGLCLPCAQKNGIAPLDQLIGQSGMSPDEFENVNQQMMTMFENVDMDQLANSMEMMEGNSDDAGAGNPFMNLLSSAFSGLKNQSPEYQPEEHDAIDNAKPNPNEGGGVKTKKKTKKKPKRKYLDTYGINLTDNAKNGQVDRIIGRHREIDRVIQILNRRSKNNPVLIGEPGVGKTAIAEGLAVRIVENQIPAKLIGTEIYLLDLTAVVAGTQFRGQFEARMKAIINEARDCGNVILVIDEVHNIVGAGEAEGGAMNAANILKPALARGEIQVIGATTLEEYRKHIEKDTALERRFQPVIVDEPSIEDSIEILKGIKGYYETFHKVIISDDIIDYAVNLSERYIHDRFLPDKAIDVIDEAGSRANLLNLGLVELEALRKELASVIDEKENSAATDDYEKAAQCKVREFNLLSRIEEIEKKCDNIAICKEDIAYVIEAWTKIPVQSISESEAKKLLNLEERLHERVIGQDNAVTRLAKTIRRNRSGFSKRNKPSSFIFVGPTGVGKTELTKALAHELYGTEEAMIRLDMSEYMEKHTVSKLIGAPPGYVGYDQAGQLTEKVRRKPYSVILLDEIEKAHVDVFNILLQILEDGRLTDSTGRVVSFENTVIIMTSNAGTAQKTNGIGFGKNDYGSLERKCHEALEKVFRPEFLNRVDETVVFTELTKDELRDIIDLMLSEVTKEAEHKKITIEMQEGIREFILEKGYDPKYGARPLRRTIQRYIEDEIAESYIRGHIKDGDTITFGLKDDKTVIYVKPKGIKSIEHGQ